MHYRCGSCASLLAHHCSCHQHLSNQFGGAGSVEGDNWQPLDPSPRWHALQDLLIIGRLILSSFCAGWRRSQRDIIIGLPCLSIANYETRIKWQIITHFLQQVSWLLLQLPTSPFVTQWSPLTSPKQFWLRPSLRPIVDKLASLEMPGGVYLARWTTFWAESVSPGKMTCIRLDGIQRTYRQRILVFDRRTWGDKLLSPPYHSHTQHQ